MKERKKTVYVAHDGAEFLTSEECLAHEKELEETFYFRVSHGADLTEGRGMQKQTLLVVKEAKHGSQRKWAELWCELQFGSRIAFVQGVAIALTWEVTQIEPESVPRGTQKATYVRAGDPELRKMWDKMQVAWRGARNE